LQAFTNYNFAVPNYNFAVAVKWLKSLNMNRMIDDLREKLSQAKTVASDAKVAVQSLEDQVEDLKQETAEAEARSKQFEAELNSPGKMKKKKTIASWITRGKSSKKDDEKPDEVSILFENCRKERDKT
jgi:chromosome segregation ATPase